MENKIILVGEPGRKGPLVMPRRRWKGYIKTEVQETGVEGVSLFGLAQDRI
jgi:hypothetical protein